MYVTISKSEESQNSSTKLIGETHKNMPQIYNSYWYLLSGCYGQPMVSKSDQRWNFKYLMLICAHDEHNISQYSNSLLSCTN